MVRVLGAYYVVGDGAIRSLRGRRWRFGDIATAGNVAARSGRSLAEIVESYEKQRDWTRVAREVGMPPAQLYLALNAPRPVSIGYLDSGFSPSAETTPGDRPAAPETQRVAGARMEFVKLETDELIRRAIATYYALPAGTLRSLEARGWNLEPILVAGNLSVRSEASFAEIVALRDSGLDWPAVAQRLGVDPEEIFRPTISRRPSAPLDAGGR